jgi:hypothetical protein
MFQGVCAIVTVHIFVHVHARVLFQVLAFVQVQKSKRRGKPGLW